ncbi:MAG: hypothetical protein ABIQ88_04755 [Chitinophagaceae bacterium]
MKKVFILSLFVLMAGMVFAQPQAAEGKAAFQKTQQPAAFITLPYADNVVEKAIEDYMSRKGVKGGSSNGYKLYRSYKLVSTQEYNSDLYFKVERKSRSEKDVSIVSLIVGKSTEDIKTRKLDSTGNTSTLEGAKELLNEMVPAIEAYDLSVQIDAQQNTITKAKKKYDGLIDDERDALNKIRDQEQKLAQNKVDQSRQADDINNSIHSDDKAMQKARKKMKNLVDDQSNGEKKIRNLQDKLEQNKRDQQKQQDEVNKQQDILSTLMAKRKS